MDLATRVSLPFDPKLVPVLGDSGAWVPGKKGSEKVECWMRRQTLAVTATQAALVTDNLVFTAPGTAINLLSAGGPVGSVLAGNAATALGFPAGYGNLTYQDSNLYPGGLLCQPAFEFVIVAIAVRPKQLFRYTAGRINHKWMDAYQDKAQQMALENIVLTFARNRETCSILLDNLPTYPNGGTNGAFGKVAPNGAAGLGQIIPLPVGLPVGAESASASSATPDSTLTVNQNSFTLAHDAFADTDSQLTAADPLIVPLEFQFFGYCRCRNPNADVCQPGGYTAPLAQG